MFDEADTGTEPFEFFRVLRCEFTDKLEVPVSFVGGKSVLLLPGSKGLLGRKRRFVGSLDGAPKRSLDGTEASREVEELLTTDP